MNLLNSSSRFDVSLVYFDFSDGAEPGSDYSSPESSSQPPNVISILAAAGNELPLLPPANLSFEKQLGRGSSFDVNLEIYEKPVDRNWDPYYVAVKHMNLGRGSRDSLRPHYAGVQNELRVLTHPSLKDNDLILPILAYGWTDSLLGQRPYLVVDYSDHGTLTQYLKRINPPLRDRREFALDVAAGLKALHDVKIIHGDVKPDNILVFDTLEMSRAQMAKLADFGGAIFELDKEQAKLYGGTALYIAPELDRRGKFQEHNRVIATKLYAADIYSFGITLWEIMKSGRSYIEESWLLNGETKRDFLHRIAEADEDAVLCRARTFCAQLLRGHSSDTISKVVKQTFEITLPDDPLRRSDIDQVLDSLGQGAQPHRPHSVYPITRIHPPSVSNSSVGVLTPRQADGSIRAFTGYYKLVVQTSKDINIVTSESVAEEMKARSKGGVSTMPFRPPPASISDFIPMDFDAFQVAAKPSTPWSVQCQIAYRLQQQARRIFVSKKDSKPETYNACLQLALCYYIGFGVRPNRESTFEYLNLSIQGNETSREIYRRAASVLKFEAHGQGLVLDYQTETDKKLEAYESSTNYFSTRIRLYHQNTSPNNASASKPIAQSKRLSLGTLIDINDLDELCEAFEKFDFSQADVSAALTRACQDGNAELALKLCSYCKSFVLNPDEPNPLHWLIMFGDETVGRVSYALVSGSHGQPGPCQQYINAAPKAGRGIFFHPEHCMELFGTPMHWAVRTRNLKLVLILKELGADINIRWSESRRFGTDIPRPALPNLSPLDIAVAFHLPEITAELLDLGAERSGGSFEEIHSAFLCIGQGFALLSRYIIHGEGSRQAIRDTIKVLVENGFEICETDSNGYDPILVALRDSNCDGYIIEELIAAGARLDRSTSDDQSNAAILIAQNSASCRYNVANLGLVSPYVVDINASDTYGRNALHYASIGGSEAMIEALSGVKGFDVHARTRLGQTALHLAATLGNANAISCLLQVGANLEDVDSRGMTALQLTAVHRKIEVANVLINVGAEVSFKSKEGDKRGTVLHFSDAGASSGDTILRPLIEAHVSLQSNEIINATDSSGWTAMHKAAYFGDFSAVHALLDYHADFSLKDTAGRTALDLSLRLLKRIEIHGLGIDHERIRQLGEHAIDSFVDCLLEIKASLEDHQKA